MLTRPLPPIYLNKNADRRLRSGHPWIFSNEIDSTRTPLKDFEPGDDVAVFNASGKPFGTAYINPHTLICARMISRDPSYSLDASLLQHRLNIALALRQRFFPQPFYRLIYGDSDGFPGLVVDRFGAVVVAQINTAGMERRRDDIIAVLNKTLHPQAIVLRNDSAARELEGLTSYVEVVHGSVPDEIVIEENGACFAIDVLGGQKTGWFYDHRMNRLHLQNYVKDCRVLDLFSYSGAWGIQAAHAGAREVLAVDSSVAALAHVSANAARNGVAAKLTTVRGDVFDVLKQLREQNRKFDIVVADPPAFIKRRKDHRAGEQAYRRLNQMAMQVLDKDGLLVAASCSLHLTRAELHEITHSAARHVDRHSQILMYGGLGPDHPIHPAIPESDYLKALFMRVFR
jgi:23S rRNA (cytosine1962-C5)-methyltransferase